MNGLISQIVFLSHVATTLYMTGLIWFVQRVHYPLMGSLSSEEFANYERRHMSLTTWVVAPPMLIETLTAVLLLLFRPAGVTLFQVRTGGLLLAVIWLSTIYLQVPCHNSLSHRFDASIHRRLVITNWIRTIAWSLRGLLAIFMVWIILKRN